MYPLLERCPRCGAKSLLYFPSGVLRVHCTVCRMWMVMSRSKSKG